MDALKNDEIFGLLEITGLPLVDLQSLVFWVMESSIRSIHR